jgi:glutathione S-transferase
MLKVYGFSKVNAGARTHTRDLRVLWTLEELHLPYEIVGMDHPAGDLNTEAYHRLSPFDQIPAIDDEGQVLSESGAILLHLARKAGRLIPRDSAGEAQVLRWCFAALSTVELPLMALMVHDWTADAGCARPREFLVGWVHRALGNLEGWLACREFVATDDFTVADILMAHVLSAGVKDALLIAPFPGLMAYRDRCLARPAWKRAFQAYCERVEAA